MSEKSNVLISKTVSVRPDAPVKYIGKPKKVTIGFTVSEDYYNKLKTRRANTPKISKNMDIRLTSTPKSIPKINQAKVEQFMTQFEVVQAITEKTNRLSYIDVMLIQAKIGWYLKALEEMSQMQADESVDIGEVYYHGIYGPVQIEDIDQDYVLVNTLDADVELPGFAITPDFDALYENWSDTVELKQTWVHQSELIKLKDIKFRDKKVYLVTRSVGNGLFATEDLTEEWRDRPEEPEYAGMNPEAFSWNNPDAPEEEYDATKIKKDDWRYWKPQKFGQKIDEAITIATEEGFWAIIEDLGYNKSLCAQLQSQDVYDEMMYLTIDDLVYTGKLKVIEQDKLLGLDGKWYIDTPWYQRMSKTSAKKLGIKVNMSWMNPEIPRIPGEKVATVQIAGLVKDKVVVADVTLNKNGILTLPKFKASVKLVAFLLRMTSGKFKQRETERKAALAAKQKANLSRNQIA